MVIHLVTPEYPPAIGGLADYTRALAEALTEAGEQVHVWCPQHGTEATHPFGVHADLGAFSKGDLDHFGAELDAFPAPRRLIVQWVPHGYGRRSMNLAFCFWLWKRARGGDEIELMVHEPFLAWREGTWRQTAAAGVHRLMTVILLRAARRVWMSIPAWEPMWRPYALGRRVPFGWLPVPNSLPAPDPKTVSALRTRFRHEPGGLVGHVGTYGGLVTPLLSGVLPEILRQKGGPRVLLIGAGSEAFRTAFLSRRPDHSNHVYATGTLSTADVAAHVAACDVLVQPYPDGVSSRRTTAMAGLAFGVPVVTTRGRLSEALWSESGAVRLSEVGDSPMMARQVEDLLRHPEARLRLGEAGRSLYQRSFEMRRTIDALMGRDSRKVA
ncbi:MAG TPA: glycosyltransferase family 4 protein [Vicinamibacterales bacterium]|nr:glycosyltransferase family 4 protein [Vicinamibacterales bacterium]